MFFSIHFSHKDCTSVVKDEEEISPNKVVELVEPSNFVEENFPSLPVTLNTIDVSPINVSYSSQKCNFKDR